MALLAKAIRTQLSTVNDDTVDITSSGFGTPKVAIFWSAGTTASGVNSAIDSRMSFGFTNGTDSFVTCCYDEHSVGTTNSQSRASDNYDGLNRVVMHIDETSTIGVATFDSWITDGVRIRMEEGFSSAFYVTALLLGDTAGEISNSHIGTETIPATESTPVIDVTSPGFQPELIIAAHGPISASNVNEDHAQIGVTFGERDGTSLLAQSVSHYSHHNVDTSEVAQYSDSLDTAHLLDNSGIASSPQFFSFDSQGFSLRQLKSGGGTSFDLGYLALAGDFSTNLFIDQYSIGSGTGDKSQTGVGFKPGCVFQCIGSRIPNSQVLTGPTSFGLGAFDGSDEFCDSIFSWDNSGTSETRSTSYLTSFHALSNGTSRNLGAFVSFDDDGWTENYTTSVATTIAIGIAFDSQTAAPETETPSTEEPLTISTPASSRDTRLTLDTPPAGTTKTQWRITPPGESAFTITTTSSGTDSANVSDSDLTTLDIWLPPSHTYALETRHFTNGSWGAWATESSFTSRGPLNSYEKYLALSGISGVDNIDAT